MCCAVRFASDPRGGRLFTTVGVHPTRCREFEEEGAFATPTLENEDARLWAQVLQKLKQSGLDLESFPARAQAHLKRMFQVYRQDKQTPLSDGGSRIVAVGEMGLDEDREHFCPLETQKKLVKRKAPFDQESRGIFASVSGGRRGFLPCLKIL